MRYVHTAKNTKDTSAEQWARVNRTPTLVRTHPSEETSSEEPAWGKLPPNVYYYLLPESTDARNSHEADSVSSHKRRFEFAQTHPIRQNRSNARWSKQGQTREVLIKKITRGRHEEYAQEQTRDRACSNHSAEQKQCQMEEAKAREFTRGKLSEFAQEQVS